MTDSNASKVDGFMRELGVIGVAFDGGVPRYVVDKKESKAMSDEPIEIGSWTLKPDGDQAEPSWELYPPSGLWSDWLALARKILEREEALLLQRVTGEIARDVGHLAEGAP